MEIKTFDFKRSLSSEKTIITFISEKMPFLHWTDGIDHDCFCKEIPIEIKIELGYTLSGESIVYPELKEKMLKNHDIKTKETPNIFFEIFSDWKNKVLGGAIQSYFKHPTHNFIYASIFPYNDKIILMNAHKIIRLILLSTFDNTVPINNKKYITMGTPIRREFLKNKMGAIEVGFNVSEEDLYNKSKEILSDYHVGQKPLKVLNVKNILFERYKHRLPEE